MARRYWLMKTEPDAFGLKHLKRCKNQTTLWDGVRNYQARNLMRDEIKKGDGVLFYHSRISPPEIVALCEVTREAYTDPTQFRPKEKYYDPKSDKADPRWVCVDIQLKEELTTPVTLPELKESPGLEEMMVIRRGARLSIQPVTPAEWKIILKLGRRKKR